MSSGGICKYDFIKEEWKLCMKFPENANLRMCQAFISSTYAPNSVTNKLFLTREEIYKQYEWSKEEIYNLFSIIDIDPKQCKIQNDLKQKEPLCLSNLFGYQCIIYPSNVNPKHHNIIPIARDDTTPTIQSSRDWEFLTYRYDYNDACMSRGIIHIPSQNRLLAFGGWASAEYDRKDVYSHSNIWTCLLDRHNEQLQWEIFGHIPKEQQGLQLVMTADERFIIIFGGYCYRYVSDHTEGIDDIYVLDVETMDIYVSEIVSPLEGYQVSGCIISNKEHSRMIINGYSRCIMDIPNDIQDIISLYHPMEYFNISDGHSHFQIYLSEILDKKKKKHTTLRIQKDIY